MDRAEQVYEGVIIIRDVAVGTAVGVVEGVIGGSLPVESGSQAGDFGRDLGIEIVDAAGKVLIVKGVIDMGSGTLVVAGSVTVTAGATAGTGGPGGVVVVVTGPAAAAGLGQIAVGAAEAGTGVILVMNAERARDARGGGGHSIYVGKYRVNERVLHHEIKPAILKRSGDYKSVVGNNPNVNVRNGKIVLEGQGPFKGRTFETGLDASEFFGP